MADTPSPSIPRLLFGLSTPVDRKQYITAGVSLMLLKYALDAGAIYLATGTLLHPVRFFSPLWSQRVPDGPAPFSAKLDVDLLLLGMSVWALIFMWIGVTMSIRRAVNAGQNGWLGVLFMVPVINFVVMLVLSVLPPSDKRHWQPPTPAIYRQHGPQESLPDAKMPSGLRSALIGTVMGIAIGLSMLGVSVYLLGSYGSVLFFFTPFAMGAVAGYVYNQGWQRSVGMTLGVAMGTVVFTGLAMILLALEGFICIVMAAPIASVVAAVGALIGRALAAQSGAPRRAAWMLLVLPGMAGAEAKLVEPPVHEVITTIEIDARPEKVWHHVVGFSELPPPRRALFDMGIAYPMRARIEGSGVGAVRYCEFSTGPFVEPITRWEPPHRLSFDVSSQPPAMKETSPWADVYPPHLDDSLKSRRGEFRLIALPGGRTRLEGSTWYSQEMAPADYWRFWSDLMIHSIHHRVLEQVKTLSEADG